jgi:hypothetical protein
LKIAIRSSQKINSRIHNSRIAIWQRIARLGINMIGSHYLITIPIFFVYATACNKCNSTYLVVKKYAMSSNGENWMETCSGYKKMSFLILLLHWTWSDDQEIKLNTSNFLSHTQRQDSYQILLLAVDFMLHFKFLGYDWTIEYLQILHSADQYIHICPMSHTQWHSPM